MAAAQPAKDRPRAMMIEAFSILDSFSIHAACQKTRYLSAIMLRIFGFLMDEIGHNAKQ